MTNQQTFSLPGMDLPMVHFGVTQRSNRLINYFLIGYFLLGLIFASFYHTWLIGIGGGGFLLIAYYSVKKYFPAHCLYQYVLSVILGLFMAQFIYQMHGMIEMHFFTFIGSALLITYQNWKLQLPLLIFVILHHALFGHLQDIGTPGIYFSQLHYLDLQTFVIHMLLTMVIFIISGLCAYQLHRYHQFEVQQTEQMALLQEAAKLSIVRQKNTEAMEERNTILESISDAFFAVDKNWMVTYWNQTAERLLHKTKKEMLTHNLWKVFKEAVDSNIYRKYHQAMETNKAVHFEDYYAPMNRWFEISAYPSSVGLSVYFKDITERKLINSELQESEQRYSDVFHFSPLPMWVADLNSLRFMDVNRATIAHYGYSREEFLTMTLMDIRPKNEFREMERALELAKSATAAIANKIMVHQKKNGELMNVEIQIAPFQFRGAKTSIVIATDITERLRYVQKIEQQNEKLQNISWMQSHVIRAPLARIMGLIPIFVDLKTTVKDRLEMSEYLLTSADEMDQVIRDITDITQHLP